MSKKTQWAISTNTKESEEIKESLGLIEDLKFFLATAPANWQENQVIRRYYLNHDEGFVSCVFWNNLYFITGTDIVRCIVYRFEHFGRKIVDRKKFEEGIFSDLRNLKCSTDAILEPPRSEFLEFLFKNSCLRTQKKQKVFFWFNVPHDKLMADALERDLKKEKSGHNPTTVAHKEPALSFKYDESSSLYTQLQNYMEYQARIHESAPSNQNMGVSEVTTASGVEEATSTVSTTLQQAPEPKKENGESFSGNSSAKFKTNADYEDDFPLDYFNPNDPQQYQEGQMLYMQQSLPQHYVNTMGNEEYIALEANYHNGAIAEESYDSIVDPSVFIYPQGMSTQPSQVVYNDEYLIEQTQPLKTPLPPKSARMPGEDFFPPQPMSAKYQTTFARQLHPGAIVKTPLHATHFAQKMPPNGAMYDTGGGFYPMDAQFAYKQQRGFGDQEYWIHPGNSYYGGSMEPMMHMPMNSHHIDQDYGLQGLTYPVMNPAIVSMKTPTQMQNPSNPGHHLIRQNPKNSAMLMKKRQLLAGKGGISKPSFGDKHTVSGSLDDVISSKQTRVVLKREDPDHKENVENNSENAMQTPPTSSTQNDPKR